MEYSIWAKSENVPVFVIEFGHGVDKAEGNFPPILRGNSLDMDILVGGGGDLMKQTEQKDCRRLHIMNVDPIVEAVSKTLHNSLKIEQAVMRVVRRDMILAINERRSA